MEYITEPARQIPVYSRNDIVVIGGGVAGLSAAVASKRLGCNPLLIEEGACLGGIATLGLCANFMGDRVFNRGFYIEIYEKMKEAESLIEGLASTFDPEVLKWLVLDIVEKERIELLLYTRVVDVIRDKNKIRGVIIENKAGRQAIMGDVFIDASGDGDVAAMAGEAFETVKEGEQAMTLLFRVMGVDIYKFADFVKNHPDKSEFFSMGGFQDLNMMEMEREKPLLAIMGLYGTIKKARERGELYLPHDCIGILALPAKGTCLINATHTMGRDPLSAKDLTLAEIDSRKQMMSVCSFLKRNIPGFESASLLDSASRIGVRESRRIVGEYVVTFENVKEGLNYDDTIAMNFLPIDIHGPGEQQTWIKLKSPYSIPYRSLLAKVNENLLVAGRCISVDHHVINSARSIPCCIATGQAAGTGAALSILEKKSPKKIDIEKLKSSLKKQGAVITKDG